MISPLRRKHQITAPKYQDRTAVKRRLRSLAAVVCFGIGYTAVEAAEPFTAASPSSASHAAAKRPNLTGALPWRSPGVAPTPVAVEATTTTTMSTPASTLRPSSPPALRPVEGPANAAAQNQGSVAQVSTTTMLAPANSLRMSAPTIQRTMYQQGNRTDTPRPIAPPPQSDIIQGIPPQPPAMESNGFALPPNTPVPTVPSFGIPQPTPTPAPQDSVRPPAIQPPANQAPMIGPTVIEPDQPPAQPTLPEINPTLPEANNVPRLPGDDDAMPQITNPAESPSDRPQTLEDNPYRNPFNRDLSRPDLTPSTPEPSEPSIEKPSAPQTNRRDQSSRAGQSQLSCDDIRERVKQRSIDKISLDIAPPFRPDIIDQARLEKLRADFLKSQPSRTWRDVQGRSLFQGTLQDLENDKVVLKTSDGRIEKIAMIQLSEPDVAFVNEQWGLPRSCRVEQAPYEGRNWAPMTFVWKASGNCHKPLYFEEVQLERYGHSTGPFLQPVLSSAHFFVNIAVLPYKMGIHPLSECQYALGYYRPGNCAPWMIPPIPLSLRGAIAETAVVGGGIALIP